MNAKKLNPLCSKVSVNRGSINFVFFYFYEGDKRRQIKFSDGLNKKGISKSETNRLIKAKVEEINNLLNTLYFDGINFIEGASMPFKKPSKQGISVKEASNMYLKSKKGLIRDITYNNYASALFLFEKWLGKDKALTAFSSADALEYIKDMLNSRSPKTKRKLSKMTIREYSERIKYFFNWCIKQKMITENPFDTDMGTIFNGIQNNKHKSYSIEEWQSIVTYFKQKKPVLLTPILLIYYCHLRVREVLRLQLKDIDLNSRYITLPAEKGKTNRERRMAIDAPLHLHLISLNLDYNDRDKYLIGLSNRKAKYAMDKPLLLSIYA